jgi:hypothetical protein
MKIFKFLNENVKSIEDDPLYHLNVYENMALRLISWCQRMNLPPVGYQHQFYESGSSDAPGQGINRHLIIYDITRHHNFGSLHVRIFYVIYDRNGTDNHVFHLDEQVFESVMRRYENI